MALISDVLGIVIAIIIFIILVQILFNVFGSPECDKLAIATAENLRIGIDKVALGDGISPYSGEGVPPNEAKNQFTVVPIRLCQGPKGAVGGEVPFLGITIVRIPLGSIGTSLAATIPTYEIVYETWPDAVSYLGGLLSGWSESQPFSSGAINSFLTYAAIRWGPKLVYNIAKYAFKGAGWLIRAVDQIIGDRIFKFLMNHADNRFFRFVLTKAFAEQLGESVPSDIEAKFFKIFYKEEDSGVIQTLRKNIVEEKMNIVDAMADAGVLESEWDEELGKYVPVTSEEYVPRGALGIVTKKEMYVVKPEFRNLFKTFISLEEDEGLKSLYENVFYIPSSWNWVENIKVKWYKFGYSICNNGLTDWFSENVIQKTKALYGDLKNGFNKVFRRSASKYDTAAEAAAFKEWAFIHFDQFENYVLDEDNFQNLGFRQALEDVTGKILPDSSWVSSEDLYNFLVKYDRYYNSLDYEEFISRSTSQIRSFAVSNMQNILSDSATNAIEGGDIVAFGRLTDQFKWSWDLMPPDQQDAWMENMMRGYTGSQQLSRYDTGIIYSDLRAHLIKEGALDESKMLTGGVIRANRLTNIIDKVKGGMFTEPLNYNFIQTDEFANTIPNYWLRPIAPAEKSWFASFKEKVASIKDTITNNIAYKKAKQFVILDLGRFGSSPISPFDPLGGGGAYTAKQTLTKGSQIMPGGCQEKSICMLKDAEVKGPEPGYSAFSLDEKVPTGTEVRLWRPKPSVAARTPIFMSTALFYATVPENPRFYVVSPCFAVAKIWKSGKDDKIYVKIDKADKCNVTECPSGVDTPNYCYADEEYIWGSEPFSMGNMLTAGDVPSQYPYIGGALGCAAAMTIATHGNFFTALRICSYSAIGVLTANTIGATAAYRDVPSWKRQETGWGYWNFQKAGDICNILDIMASIGAWKGGPINVKGANWQPSSQPGMLSKLGGKIKSNLGAGDLCYAMLAIGDTSLAWPIKTMFPEIWRKGAGLTETCMQDTAPECAWLNRTG